MIHVSDGQVVEAPSCGISSFVGGWAVDNVAVEHAYYQEPSPDIEGQGQVDMTRRRNPGASVAFLCRDSWRAAEVKVVGAVSSNWNLYIEIWCMWKYNGEIQTKAAQLLQKALVSHLHAYLCSIYSQYPFSGHFSSRSYECMNESRLVRPIETRFFWIRQMGYAPCFRKKKKFTNDEPCRS